MGAQSGDPSSGAPGTPRGPGARAPATSFGGQMVMSVSVVTEFVRWNEEAVQRCTLLTPQVS